MRSAIVPASPHVAVIGAGVCGLYAARALAMAGLRVSVLEKADAPGGLAAGCERNGNYFDLGVHQLHAFDHGIFDDIATLMGDRLIASEKCAKIRYGRGYRRYPLEFLDLLSGIPPWTLASSLIGLGAQSVVNRLNSTEPKSAEDALIQLYGRPLYGYFFQDFTHRYWGIPPSGLSASFVRTKMPRLSAVDVIKQALGRFGLKDADDSAVESAVAHETLYYWRTGSRELPIALVEDIAAHGGRVHVGSPVVGVNAHGERVSALVCERDGRTVPVPCDAVVSTMPLADLVRGFRPSAPEAVLAACGGLKHKALAVYGLLVRREQVLDAQFVYYRNRAFHRVAEPKASGLVVTPPDHTVLLVETTCDVGDDRWSGGEATRQRIVGDLEDEGLLRGDEIAEMHVLGNEHAYPVFELGFETHRDTLLEFLGGFVNIVSTGRQGGFLYPNMHEAMRMGATAAADVQSCLIR